MRKPVTLSESFEIIREQKFISGDLCKKLIQMTGFRNTLVHGYERIDDAVLLEVVKNGKNDIKEFLKMAEKQIS